MVIYSFYSAKHSTQEENASERLMQKYVDKLRSSMRQLFSPTDLFNCKEVEKLVFENLPIYQEFDNLLDNDAEEEDEDEKQDTQVPKQEQNTTKENDDDFMIPLDLFQNALNLTNEKVLIITISH